MKKIITFLLLALSATTLVSCTGGGSAPSNGEITNIFTAYFTNAGMPVGWGRGYGGPPPPKIDLIEVDRIKSIRAVNGGMLPDSYVASGAEDCWSVVIRAKGMDYQKPFDRKGQFLLCKMTSGSWHVEITR
jgi:hypothetical protein